MSNKRIEIEGFATSRFRAVKEAFIENFKKRKETGGACCVFHRGEKVVDLWGGTRSSIEGERWEEDTMVLVYSTSKGITGLTLAYAHSQGLFSYDDAVSKHWPEFAAAGKEKITIRQLFSHQAGLPCLDFSPSIEDLRDLDSFAKKLAKQKPLWPPGTRHGYHAITLGFYQNEILRRLDPKKRSIGQYFQEEIATPLDLDFYLNLPRDLRNSRLATIKPPNMATAFFKVPLSLILASLNPNSVIRRALWAASFPLNDKTVYTRDIEIPSGGGVGTARSIAKLYGDFAVGGKLLALRQETLAELSAYPPPPKYGLFDEALKVNVTYGLGFLKPDDENPFGSEQAYGSPGTGGSFGFADPQNEIGYGYVTNMLDSYLIDPRDEALRRALTRSLS